MKKIIIMICLLCLCFPITAYATEYSDETEELLKLYDFGELNTFLEENFPNEKMNFLEMMQGFMTGEIEFSFSLLWDLISEQFLHEFQSTKGALVHVLAIVIIAAVFRNFAGTFENGQISEMCFCVLYMLLVTICLNSFRMLMQSAVAGLGLLLEFLKLLGPVYFFAVAIATGSTTSISFNTMILLLISIVEMVIQSLLLPLAQVYMMIRLMNDFSKEEYMSKMAEFLHTIIVWGLRILLGAVIGINMIQGMLTPAIDSVKRSVLVKTGEAIPMIGDILGGTTEVVLGTAVLIKNGIGVAGAIVCIAICMTPVIQMVVVTLMYKLTAALIQPISEKRVVGCISSMADGATILLRVVFTSGVLFLVTIAMVATTTV